MKHISELHTLFQNSKGICTDTRKIIKNSLFFALKGDNFNGNTYALKAIEQGCDYAIVDDVALKGKARIIVVDSVLKTLQDLANFHRKQFSIPIIGITGSNGKTTSKELIGCVLEKKYNLLMTQGNLNNHLGVPFTLLNLNNKHEIAIIEMGANKPGDIKELVDIAEPTHGIITNIGVAHIEGFGSIEGVIKTKLELFDFIGENNGTIFINNTDSILMNALPKTECITYGDKLAHVFGKTISLNPYLNFSWVANGEKENKVNSKLVGEYNLPNFLAAVTIGNYFEIDNTKISKALTDYTPSNNRSQITETEKNTIVVDCYNANPSSMTLAIKSFSKMTNKNQLLIIGDMLELGNVSDIEHQKIIKLLKVLNKSAVLVGEEFFQQKSSFKSFKTIDDLLKSNLLNEVENSLILLKGSRGIKLEKLIDIL